MPGPPVARMMSASFMRRFVFGRLGASIQPMIRATMLINGALNAKIVGQRPVAIARMAGFEVPEDTKILIGEATSTDNAEAFGHEKLTTILGMYRSKDFDDALDIAEALLVNNGGLG